MKIDYDKEADAFNIEFKTGPVDRTVELSPLIFLDLDKKGNPLYLEIIGARERLGKKSFGKITIGKKLFSLPAFA
jgi:uncharacterized protein YuzE